MKRIITLLVILALVVAGGLLLSTTAGGETTDTSTTTTTTTTPDVPPNWDNSADYRAQVVATYKAAVRYKKATHFWSHKRGVHGPAGIHRPMKMTHSLTYEQWRAGLWRSRAKAARAQYHAWVSMWNHRDRSINAAIRYAAARYHVSRAWLSNCVGSEGGHGVWVWNSSDGVTRTIKRYPLSRYPNSARHPGGSSGAGGWFQFMSGTYYGASTKTKIPARFKRWDSPLGQATAAAYMFKSGGSGAWSGGSC